MGPIEVIDACRDGPLLAGDGICSFVRTFSSAINSLLPWLRLHFGELDGVVSYLWQSVEMQLYDDAH